jgi:chromosome segregation ATPase
LEEEVEKLKSELKIEKDSKQLTSQYMESIHHNLNTKDSNANAEVTHSEVNSEQNKENGAEQASNLSIELQNVLEKQSKELAESRVRLGELQNKLKDFEERNHTLDEKYTNLHRDYLNSIETNRKLQLGQKEMLVQREEHERRLSNLEQRYIQSQRECSTLSDMNNRLETELAIKENSLKHVSFPFTLLTRYDSGSNLKSTIYFRTKRNTKICKPNMKIANKNTKLCSKRINRRRTARKSNRYRKTLSSHT